MLERVTKDGGRWREALRYSRGWETRVAPFLFDATNSIPLCGGSERVLALGDDLHRVLQDAIVCLEANGDRGCNEGYGAAARQSPVFLHRRGRAVAISYTVHNIVMPNVKAQAFGIEMEARGGNPPSSCPIAGVFVLVQDADLIPVYSVANSQDVTVVTMEDIVAGVANSECRGWHRGIVGRGGSCNRWNVNALIHNA